MRTLGMYMDGGAPEIRDPEGREVSDNDFLLLLNAHHEAVEFTLPHAASSPAWTLVVDTARPDVNEGHEDLGQKVSMEGRSLVLVSRRRSSIPDDPQRQG
jgi:isoamylase